MIRADVLIVGAGPAGSAAAWKLKKAGKDVLILDKSPFPRLKLCAGWITPRTMKKLAVSESDYPHGIIRFPALHFHIYSIPLPLPTRQYSIRRIEFDNWLLERADVPVSRHRVQRIRREGDSFLIDNRFSCKWLIGAGGTNCPVYRSFFRGLCPRDRKKQIVSMELEFQGEPASSSCHLWFFQNKLPGYAWYVPKAGGWLNIGVGGKQAGFQGKGRNIRDHWKQFTDFLLKKKLLKTPPPAPGAYSYFLRHSGPAQNGRAMIIGDAAGLATLDMGEGIGPAIESGLLAAESILSNTSLSFDSIPRYSLPGIFFPGKR